MTVLLVFTSLLLLSSLLMSSTPDPTGEMTDYFNSVSALVGPASNMQGGLSIVIALLEVVNTIQISFVMGARFHLMQEERAIVFFFGSPRLIPSPVVHEMTEHRRPLTPPLDSDVGGPATVQVITVHDDDAVHVKLPVRFACSAESC